MNQVQQQFNFNRSYDQKSISITTIENLSNESFYEIFDYIDGYDIHQAFSNLNYRFQQLLNSSLLLFKIQLGSLRNGFNEKISKQLIFINKHQIFSFHLYLSSHHKKFFLSFPIDSSFDHLQSLVLNEIKSTVLSSLLTNLTSLPRLFSLTINTCYTLYDLSDVYRLIFDLPKLKYFKCSSNRSSISLSLPIATTKQLSSIEHLIINHSCSFEELSIIISYTPQLHHLNCIDIYDKKNLFPIRLSNLTHISIRLYDMTFDELEMFITQIACKLKVLRVDTNLSEDMDYLDANRWEEFIFEYFPELNEFYLHYAQEMKPDYDRPIHLENNQFISSFWIERKWILDIQIDYSENIYSIRPYKERWYDVNSSIELIKSTRLTLMYLLDDECLPFLMITIRNMFRAARIYHLEIFEKQIFSNVLVEIMYTSHELHSLKIFSLSLLQSKHLSTDKKKLGLVTKKNNITKVYLEKLNEIEELYFLMKLCPRMKYLKIDFINNMDVEVFIKYIIMKINNEYNQYLRSLCFRVPTADDKMIEKLQKMINCEKLLHQYTMKRVLDNIYLQWDS